MGHARVIAFYHPHTQYTQPNGRLISLCWRHLQDITAFLLDSRFVYSYGEWCGRGQHIFLKPKLSQSQQLLLVKHWYHPKPRFSHQRPKIQFWRNRATKAACELISSCVGIRWTNKCSCVICHAQRKRNFKRSQTEISSIKIKPQLSLLNPAIKQSAFFFSGNIECTVPVCSIKTFHK